MHQTPFLNFYFFFPIFHTTALVSFAISGTKFFYPFLYIFMCFSHRSVRSLFPRWNYQSPLFFLLYQQAALSPIPLGYSLSLFFQAAMFDPLAPWPLVASGVTVLVL